MITAKDKWGYDLAMQVAKLSQCRYRLGAVIVKGSRVLSVGCNVTKSHPIHKEYPNWTISIHAEHSAILKATTDVSGATVFVARQGGNKASKPCSFCLAVLLEAGIKEIVYYNGALVRERIQ